MSTFFEASPSAAQMDDDEKPPPYSKPGRIMVEVIQELEPEHRYGRWECEVIDYDADSGVFWMSEGIGLEYWIDNTIDGWPAPIPGVFVIENIKGHYHKGEWGFDDDDEEWEHGLIRVATQQEIESKCLVAT